MRKFHLFIGFLIGVLALISCEKDSDNNPELYGEYLTIEITSINENISDSIFQIQIFNSQDKVFEQDCKLNFTLTNKLSGNVYSAEENVVNKRIPDNPSYGFLNLQRGGHFTTVSYLNQLNWTGKTDGEIEPAIPLDFFNSNKALIKRTK